MIKYNRRTGDRIVKEFPGRLGHRDALKLRLQLERERESRDWEVVSLNSDSLETVKMTHSRYFTGHVVGA